MKQTEREKALLRERVARLRAKRRKESDWLVRKKNREYMSKYRERKRDERERSSVSGTQAGTEGGAVAKGGRGGSVRDGDLVEHYVVGGAGGDTGSGEEVNLFDLL